LRGEAELELELLQAAMVARRALVLHRHRPLTRSPRH
jgi:hypothetical protein